MTVVRVLEPRVMQEVLFLNVRRVGNVSKSLHLGCVTVSVCPETVTFFCVRRIPQFVISLFMKCRFYSLRIGVQESIRPWNMDGYMMEFLGKE